jgi:hypothetical protein
VGLGGIALLSQEDAILFCVKLLLWLLFPVCLPCTTVVAFRTSDAIFVGADSEVSGRGNSQACKIGKISSNELFAQSGFYTYGDDIRGVVGDFWRVTRAALEGEGTFEQRIANYETGMLKALRDFYGSKWSNVIPPDKRKPDAILMETMFLKFRNGRPIFEQRGFVYRDRSAVLEPSLTNRCLEDCKSPLMYMAAGVRDELNIPFVKDTQQRLGTVGAINSLIKLEAATHPTLTGGLISIARLDGAGVQYIQPGACNIRHADK